MTPKNKLDLLKGAKKITTLPKPKTATIHGPGYTLTINRQANIMTTVAVEHNTFPHSKFLLIDMPEADDSELTIQTLGKITVHDLKIATQCIEEQQKKILSLLKPRQKRKKPSTGFGHPAKVNN